MMICNFRKRDFQFAKQEPVWNSTVRKEWEGPLETSKPSKKLSTTAKPQKDSIKTENLMQNRQNL